MGEAGASRGRVLPALLAALGLLAAAPGAARGQATEPGGADEAVRPELPERFLGEPGARPEGERRPAPAFDLESWIILEEETAPPPPLLRLQVGVLGWLDSRSRIRADRGGRRGTELDDLEREQGLQSGGAAPWLELTLGAKVRVGLDMTYFERGGAAQRQDEPVVFDGIDLAAEGDYIRTRFRLLSAAAFVEWSALYGVDYRLGLLGGLRYFRVDVDLQGIRPAAAPVVLTSRTHGELLSPTFGGFVELAPFPYLSVYSRIQFMNWSWSPIGLKEARYLEFRLGTSLELVPGALSVDLEYRVAVVRAEARAKRGDDDQLEAGLLVNGLMAGVTLEF